jgi:hypothetical protein
VGWAEFKTRWITENGRKLLALRAVARTNWVADKIYPVDDEVETIVEPDTFLPLRHTCRIREAQHRRHDRILFDHGRKRAQWMSLAQGKQQEIAIESDSRDVLSLAYFMRSKEFKVGQQEKFRVAVDNKLYELAVTGLSVEKLDVGGLGRTECIKVEPRAKFGEIFVRKGRIWLWFSNDRRHLCALMGVRLAVASLKAVLTGVETPAEGNGSPEE